MKLTKANGDYFIIPFANNAARNSLDIKVKFIPNLDGVNDITIFSLDNDAICKIINATTIPTIELFGVNTNIPVIIGAENNIRLKRIYKDSSKFVTELWNEDSNEYYVIGDQLVTYPYNGNIVFGSSAYTIPVSDSNIEIISCYLSGDIIDFRQKRLINDSKYISQNGIIGNLITTNENAVRINEIDFVYKNIIYISGENKIISGASVSIVGDANSPYISDEYGAIYPNLKVGNYDVTITKDNFQDYNTQFTVDVNGTFKLIELDLILVSLNKEYPTYSKEGTDDDSTGVLGYFLTKPDGTKTYFNPTSETYEELGSFVGKVTRHYSSISELRKSPKAKLGDLVQTTSRDNDNYGGGAPFKCISNNAILDGYIDNGGAIIVTSNNDVFELAQTNNKIIDVAIFGAKADVTFANTKDPKGVDPVIGDAGSGTPPSTDCYDAVNNALTWLHRNSNDDKIIDNGVLVFNGHFYAADNDNVNGSRFDALFNIPRGISIWMEGNSSMHYYNDSICFQFTNAFSSRNRISTYYAFSDPIKRAWYVKDGEIEPVNKYSEGVRILNSRRNYFEIESYGATKGIYPYGKGEGTVENEFVIRDLRNNQWGIYAQKDYSGWSNQNNFSGGRIIFDGYSNRHPVISVECGCIYMNGNNCNFRGINLEGASTKGLQYTIKEVNGGKNTYIGLRFEGSTGAGMIVLSEGSFIVEGSHYQPNKLGFVSNFYSRGDAQIELTRGFIQSHGKGSEAIGEGSMLLTGTRTNVNSALNGTLNLSVLKSVQRNAYINFFENTYRIKHQIREDSHLIFNTKANEFLDLELIHQEQTIYNLTNLVVNEWFGIGDWFDDGGTKYTALKPFKCTSLVIQDEVNNSNLVLKPTVGNAFRVEDNNVFAEGYKTQNLKGDDSKGLVAKMPHGIHTNFLRTIAVADINVNTTSFDLKDLGDYFLKNTSGSLKTLSFLLSNVRYFAGKELTIYNIQKSAYQNFDSADIELLQIKNNNGNRVILKQGHWVKIKLVVDQSTASASFQIVSQSHPTASVLTGNVLRFNDINTCYYNMGAASADEIYTIAVGLSGGAIGVNMDKIIGGKIEAFINTANQPSITEGNYKANKGDAWLANTNMYMISDYNGNEVKYWFELK